jgi:hypothetical protein
MSTQHNNPNNALVPVDNKGKIEMARSLASSNLLPQQYRGKPENLLWAINYAESVNVHPMVAVTGIHVIDGKPSASAQLIAALVRRAGHKLRVTFDRTTMTATARIIRADDPEFTFESVWTLARAKEAGLAGKNVWKTYPDAMLKARAITEVARDAAPEALYGVIYTPEELGAEVTVDATTGEMAPTGSVIVISGDRVTETDPFSGDDTITAEQVARIAALADELELTAEQVAAGCRGTVGVAVVELMSTTQAATVIERMEAKAAKAVVVTSADVVADGRAILEAGLDTARNAETVIVDAELVEAGE